MNCPRCNAHVSMIMREIGQEKRIFAPCGCVNVSLTKPDEVKDVEDGQDSPHVGSREAR